MKTRHRVTWFSCVALVAVAAECCAAALEEARQLRLTGRYDEASEAFAELAAQHPVAAALGVARCQRARGKLDQATRTLSDAVKPNAKAAELHAELGRLAFQRGDYSQAEEHVAAALKLDSNQLMARWFHAELDRVTGKLDAAQDGYLWFVRYYNRRQREIADPDDYRWIGRGAAQYARWVRNSSQFSFLVNTLYPKAPKLDKNYWPTSLESGLLFLEKYNQSDAADEFNAALAINPNAAEVHAARGELALQNFDLDAARSSIDRALQINPKLIAAHQLHADLLAANFQLNKAVTVLEKALKLNPVHEETLGRLAALYRAVDGDEVAAGPSRMEAVVLQTVERNQHCGVFFETLARTLELLRKYPAAAVYYNEAHRRMPQLVAVRGRLGLMYMRLGEEAKAARLLDESFDVDPFNVRVKNSLAVLELLQSYAVIETDHFVIKFDRGQDEILAQLYAARYLEDEVYPEVVKAMGYEPEGKSLFEIFSRSGSTSGHSWFSTRMVGLPYVGTVAACAGKVVALASPDEVPGKYNWARVLKHEFVHVVNLQQTNFNIPHWFTEALAVWNEGYPRPSDWSQLLARRAAGDSLFDLDTINFGFVRPGSSDDWTLAYCQAELYAEYMVATYGEDALAGMLAAYADNLQTRAALRHCFDVSQENFEKGYREYIDQVVLGARFRGTRTDKGFVELQQAVKADPTNPDLAAELAYVYLKRGVNRLARQHAKSAQAQQEKHQLAAYVLARLHLADGETALAVQQLAGAIDEQSPQENALALLAGLRLKAGRFDESERLYQLGVDKLPYTDKWLKALARLYLESRDDEKLKRALSQLARFDADDFTLRKKLALLALAREDFAACGQWAKQALHIDVMDAEVHAALAQSFAGQKNLAEAIDEYEIAIRLDGKQLAWRLSLAELHLQAGGKDRARQVLEALLEIDAEFPGAAELSSSLKESP